MAASKKPTTYHQDTTCTEIMPNSYVIQAPFMSENAIAIPTYGSVLRVTMMDASTSANDKKWAMSILTGASGGLLGYLIGK